MKYGVDFKILEDEFGYFVVAYRIVGGVELLFDTSNTIAMTFNLLPDEYSEFVHGRFGSDEKPKNRRMHFASYDAAVVCRDGLRALIPIAVETGNLFFAE